MKNLKSLIILLLLALLLAGASISRLKKSPISVFVLKGGENDVRAFEIKLFLGGPHSTVLPLKLASEDQKRAVEILKTMDKKALRAFSKNFGVWPIVIGINSAEEGWPGYLGGGINGLIHNEMPESFDNLNPADRLYLALRGNSPPPLLFAGSEIQTGDLFNNTFPPTSATPEAVSTPLSPVHSGVMRVEILNGCGITNAAEWAAQKLKGSGIQIADTDNADNFHYSKTIVRTAAGVPVALEEAMDRLGLSKDSVEEISNPPVSVDVVVIVGKDFRKLKERARERAHH